MRSSTPVQPRLWGDPVPVDPRVFGRASILRGNRNETQTLQGLLHMLRRRFGITDATFVFDGGMSSRINLAAMNEAKLGFVIRLSIVTLRSLQ